MILLRMKQLQLDNIDVFVIVQLHPLEEPGMGPDDIAAAMTGILSETAQGRHEGFLPSPKVQNHAAFLTLLPDGALICAWFGGTLEGKSDISIYASILPAGASSWGPAQPLSGDPHRSEQNPVIFKAPDGALWLFHTAQPSGNQDECQMTMVTALSSCAQAGVRLVASSNAPQVITLPNMCLPPR